MRELFDETPLQRNDHLSAMYDADVWLKREDLTPVRSYKIRGATNAMRRALERDPVQKMFVCASAGNHAQGVAFACRQLNVRGVIFMPVTTPQQKINKTKIFGGSQIEVVLTGDYFDDTLAAAQSYCIDHKGHFLSPFDDPDVIEGQSTVGIEILDQMGEMPDLIILPVGGGGLSSGVTSVLGTERLLCVEPVGAASLTAALANGAEVTLEKVDNFVDGAAVARMGANTFELLKHLNPDQVRTVQEVRICSTLIEMLNVEGVVLEPAGALAIDVLKDIQDEIKGKTVVCVTSGGNFDFERLPDVKERAQRFLGLKKYFLLRLPQRPGALKDFLSMLGPDDDIARFEYLKKSARNFGSVLIGIETTDALNFDRLIVDLEGAGFKMQDITNDATIAEFVI